jgi:hypothetical protein
MAEGVSRRAFVRLLAFRHTNGSGPQGWQARVPMDDMPMMSFGFGPPPRPRPGNGQTGQPQSRAQQLLPNTSDWYGRFSASLQRSPPGPRGDQQHGRHLRWRRLLKVVTAFADAGAPPPGVLAGGLSG